MESRQKNVFKGHGLFKFPIDMAGEYVVEQNADRLAALKRRSGWVVEKLRGI